MKNIGSEVKEVEEVNEVKDKATRDLSSQAVRMLDGERGFSFTSCTSFTSSTSLAFTGVCS
jgi:hypothetical protein